ncbi:MAG: hypothetical protein ACFCU8_05425 [Thermosynechococcaceae cyanobacterium]
MPGPQVKDSIFTITYGSVAGMFWEMGAIAQALQYGAVAIYMTTLTEVTGVELLGRTECCIRFRFYSQASE